VKDLIFKYRGLLWGLFALAVFLFPVSWSIARTACAVPLLIGGQALRFWAAGVIPKYRTLVIGAPELVTWGPYAWVRNPLYAGNALIGLGWALMVGWPWVPAFLLAYFAIYALVIIPAEEGFLRGEFGDAYLEYRRTTPSMVPRLSAVRERLRRSRAGFDAKKSWFMERHSLRMNLVVTALVLLRLLYFGD